MKAYYSAAGAVIPISVSYARVCGKRFFSNPIWFLLALLQPDVKELGRKSMFILNTYLLAGRERDWMQRTVLSRSLAKCTGLGCGFCSARRGGSEQKLGPLRWETRSDGGVLCPDAGTSMLTRTSERETRGWARSVDRSVQEMCWGGQRLVGWRLVSVSDINVWASSMKLCTFY